MRGEPTTSVRIEPCFVCGVPVPHSVVGTTAYLPEPHPAPCGTKCIGGSDFAYRNADDFAVKARAYHCANECPAVGCLGGGRYAVAGGARG